MLRKMQKRSIANTTKKNQELSLLVFHFGLIAGLAAV